MPLSSKRFPIDLSWENGVSMLAYSFLIESLSMLLVTRTGIKARTSSISGLWFPWPIYMFFEMRFDLGTLDSGEQSLPLCIPMMLHIKYDQDWPTGFRDIQVQKCGRRRTTTTDDDGRRTIGIL